MPPKITPPIIRQTWLEFSEYDDAQVIALIKSFQKEQSSVLTYLLAAGSEPFAEDESKLLLFYGTIIWRLMKQAGYAEKRIPARVLDSLQHMNMELLTQVSLSDAELFEKTFALMESYPEPDLLDTLLNLLFHDKDADPDFPHIKSQNLGLAFLHFKTEIDGFLAQSA